MIPLSKPDLTHNASAYVIEALRSGNIQGGGAFSSRCEAWLNTHTGHPTLLTHSCTGALEMAALLANLTAGDEVIMPSFTFVSTANAVALRGAIPVFVDIRADTLNINERLVEGAVTSRTKAIIAVHYAGVCAEMDLLSDIADKYNLVLIEDAAQALMSTYHSRPAGSLGDIACFSFHETKNLTSGEGGAITMRSEDFLHRANIVRDKGTNRADFMNGVVDKYSWIDLGSSYIPSDILGAILMSQLECAQEITNNRITLWDNYQNAFQFLEPKEIQLPFVPAHCGHNGHIYYLLLPTKQARSNLQDHLKRNGIQSSFHFIPLHDSVGGKRYGRVSGSMQVTNRVADNILRLPLYPQLANDQKIVIDSVRTHYA